MMFYDKLDATLHASAVASDNSMIATDNEDVGIKVYDKYNREVNTNGGALEAETTKIPDIMGIRWARLHFQARLPARQERGPNQASSMQRQL